MFVKDQDVIDLKVYYKKMGIQYVAYTEEEFDDASFEEEWKND